MYVGGCFHFITLLMCTITAICADVSPFSEIQKRRHLYPLLGYLRGYKLGQELGLQLHPFFLSPVVVLPTVNQKQNVIIHTTKEDNNDETCEESNLIISPSKIILDPNNDKNDNVELINKLENDEGREEEKESVTEGDTFRQSIIETNTTIDALNDTDINYTTTEATDVNSTETILGPYPTAEYNNDFINNLTLSETPVKYNLTLPLQNNNWKNFTQKEKENKRAWQNYLPPHHQLSSYDRYPYHAAQYHNLVEGLSITTDSYSAPNLQYSNANNYWQNNQHSSEFRPLAGLYYDGYLHKPIIKNSGFVPYNNNYYY